mmetsp:Transcript_58164/g.120219  ORF Transcript_58164/g.120219 Transcript_58164/m.120219 type:complete len:86 (+) Transcript_58164:312-569(+)
MRPRTRLRSRHHIWKCSSARLISAVFVPKIGNTDCQGATVAFLPDRNSSVRLAEESRTDSFRTLTAKGSAASGRFEWHFPLSAGI